MQFSRWHLGSEFRYACVLTAFGIAGCGNSCFVAFSNNGNGGVIIKAGNPPPACSLSMAMGTLNVVALRAPTCRNCTAGSRMEHLYVTVRSIQLRSNSTKERDAHWLEIAPDLVNEPYQIDLIGDSTPETLLENAIVPAGSYQQVRLEFLPDAPIVMGDGGVAKVHWPGDVPEFLITSQNMENGALRVLPDTTMELRITLEPQQVFSSSNSEPWAAREVLVGHAGALRYDDTKTPRPD